jgi:adenosine deaminase
LFFGNSLAMELESAQRAHHFTRDEIRRLMLSSIEATWLSAERKKRLAADFQRDPSWNDADRARSLDGDSRARIREEDSSRLESSPTV